MKTHILKLHPEPFGKLQAGVKSLELRLCDEKRKEIEIGDQIIFKKEPEQEETFTAKVIGLVRYANFSELMDDFSPEKYLGHKDKAEALEGVSRFYTEEDQAQNGVLGIRIKLVKKMGKQLPARP